MASFSETYYSSGGFVATANSFLTGGKFLLDPELRARRIVNISQYASVDFCKSFWFLAESGMILDRSPFRDHPVPKLYFFSRADEEIAELCLSID